MKIITVLILLPFICFSQSKHSALSKDSIIRKWGNAVVHLEANVPKYNPFQIQDALDSAKKPYPSPAYNKSRDSILFAMIRERSLLTGSAVFFKDGKRLYLMTAKHVVFDKNLTINNTWNNKKANNNKVSEESISDRLSIITPFDFFLTKGLNKTAVLLSYGKIGEKYVKPYEFSDDATDIAIISLQFEESKNLLSVIKNNGYKPIDIREIDNICNFKDWGDIFAVGFPSLSYINDNPTYIEGMIQSTLISLPITTFGNIAMFHNVLPYFIADITVYPGNSGGPIIKNNRMVGIVSSQISTQIENRQGIQIPYSSRGSLAHCIKTSNVFSLLRRLQKRELEFIK